MSDDVAGDVEVGAIVDLPDSVKAKVEEFGALLKKGIIDNKPWYKSKKLWYTVGAVVVIAGLTLGGQYLDVPPERLSEAIAAVKWLFLFLIGGHTATDVISLKR